MSLHTIYANPQAYQPTGMWLIELGSLAGIPAPYCPETIPDGIVEDDDDPVFIGQYTLRIKRNDEKMIDTIHSLGGYATVSDIVNATGMDRRTIEKRLVQMKGRGVVGNFEDFHERSKFVRIWFPL